MSELSHEKYVSIEYDVWERKYKPMEKTLVELRQQLDKREIIISLQKDWGYGHKSTVRSLTVELNASGGDYLSGFNKNEFKRDLRDTVQVELNSLMREIQETNDQVKRIPRFARWLFGIKQMTPVKMTAK